MTANDDDVTGYKQRDQYERVDQAALNDHAHIQQPILNYGIGNDAGMDVCKNQTQRIIRDSVIRQKIYSRHGVDQSGGNNVFRLI